MRPERAEALLELARAAVRDAAGGRAPPRPPAGEPRADLRRPQGNFVTLTAGAGGRLRGCCGTVLPREALARELVRNAWRSAREDPRFPPLAPRELAGLHLEISLLGPLRRLEFDTTSALLSQLVPGETGLLIAAGPRRATFLPKVWESLGEPAQFLDALRRKAGISPAFPAGRLDAWRYRAELIGAPLDAARAA